MNKEELILSSRVTGWAKGIVVIISSMILVFSAFILYFVISLAQSDEIGLAFLFFGLFVLPLWILVVIIWRIAKRTAKRMEYVIKLTSEGIYEHVTYIDDKSEEEQMVYFDQLQEIYLGREPLYMKETLNHYLRMRVYWIWEKDKERYINSILVEEKEVFDDLLSRFPKHIPIRAFQYAAPVPQEAFDELAADSELVKPADGHPVDLPYPAFKMVTKKPPVWKPAIRRKNSSRALKA